MPPRREPPPSNELDPELLLKLRSVSLADNDVQSRRAQLVEATKFVNKVRTRFRGQSPYGEFKALFIKYREKSITLAELSKEMSDLFKHHDDLLSEFIKFLPTGTGPSELREEEKEEAASDPDTNMDLAD